MSEDATGWAEVAAPDDEVIEALARAALAALPPAIAARAGEISFRIVDFAPDAILDEMQIDDPFELTGLYEGIPLTERSVTDQPTSARHNLAFPSRDPR